MFETWKRNLGITVLEKLLVALLICIKLRRKENIKQKKTKTDTGARVWTGQRLDRDKREDGNLKHQIKI